jgi:hypothetical protein
MAAHEAAPFPANRGNAAGNGAGNLSSVEPAPQNKRSLHSFAEIRDKREADPTIRNMPSQPLENCI